MLSRTASTLLRRSAARYMSTEAAPATTMTLNFVLPHEAVYKGAAVDSVIIPAIDGEYGVTVDHVPTVSQLKPGVLQIIHQDGETEKYFVAGGFAFTHPNSVTVRGTIPKSYVFLYCIISLNIWNCCFRIFRAPRRSSWTIWTRVPLLPTLRQPGRLRIRQRVDRLRKQKPWWRWRSIAPWEWLLVLPWLKCCKQNVSSSSL